MIVNNEILTNWKLLREHGDVERMHEESKLNRITIATALRTGNMSDKTFQVIKKFYSDKRKAYKKLTAEALK